MQFLPAKVIGLLCTISVFASAAQAAIRPRLLKNVCETLVYQVSSLPVYSSDNFVSAFEGYSDRTRVFRRTGGSELFDRRRPIIETSAKRWISPLLEHLKAMGLSSGRTETEDGYFIVHLDRAGVLAKFPQFRRFLPDGYGLVLLPLANLVYGGQAHFSSGREEIGLPLSILYGGPDSEVEQALVHELLHLRMSEMRKSKIHRLHVHGIGVTGQARASLGPKFFPSELDFFSSEEVLAYLVNGLNFYEASCRGLIPEKPISRNDFIQSKNYLDALLDLVFPSSLNIDFANTIEDGVMSYYGERKDVRIFPLDEERLTLYGRADDKEKFKTLVRTDLLRDRESLLPLRTLFQNFERETQFVAKPRHCAKTDPFWNYLSKLGLDIRELQLDLHRLRE